LRPRFIQPPTKTEQVAIAEALSDADALIESLERLVTKKRHLKQGAMRELLRPKGGWVVKEVQDISEVDPENLGSNTRPDYAFKYISLENVDRGTLLGWSEEIFSTAPSRARRKVSNGDVLVSTVRPNLQSHYLVEDEWDDLVCSTGFSVIRCRPGVAEPRYVFAHFFSSVVERQIETLITDRITLRSIALTSSTLRSQCPERSPNKPPSLPSSLRHGRRDRRARSQARESPPTQKRHDAGSAHRENSPRMSGIGKPERATQIRVISLFHDELGYRYLGDWSDREGNSNIEEGPLTDYLSRSGYTPEQISSAIYKLRTDAGNHSRTLYGNNQAVYSLLRYGAPVKIEAGKVTETVHLINWKEPEKNDFAIAEEVTLKGNHERRPDIVLYVNGIAIGVLELKNSRVSIGDGIRQTLSNQQAEFNAWFFSSVQFIFAGNDSEGLQYGTTGTQEKYFLKWKEGEEDDSRFKLDKYLLKLCRKDRIIELMHDFVLFDGGIKKLPRVHQYFGIKAAQKCARDRKGGIIWHTQGSGKSIVMVLLAKWILETTPTPAWPLSRTATSSTNKSPGSSPRQARPSSAPAAAST
jgi:Type I restriction enzyme R protein N terminus (HSDR_N)/SWI2/SNF2 ATPase